MEIDKVDFSYHMPITQDEFRAALSRFPSGVTVVTTKDGDGWFHGITVSAFCSVSLEPPLILVCIEKITGSHAALKESDVFVVNILSETQHELSEHFASTIPDKFSNVSFTLSLNGLPVLDDVTASLECRVDATHDAGDHTIFVGYVENVAISNTHPLAYLHGDYHLIQH